MDDIYSWVKERGEVSDPGGLIGQTEVERERGREGEKSFYQYNTSLDVDNIEQEEIDILLRRLLLLLGGWLKDFGFSLFSPSLLPIDPARLCGKMTNNESATLFIEGWTHTQTQKKGEIKYLPRLVLLFVSESLAVSTKQNKKCAYCETCCGDRYAPTQKKKKKNVGIPKRKKRKWSISQSQIPWKKEKVKKIPSQQHRQSATLFLLLLSFFRVYWKIYVSKDPPKKGVIP